MEINKKIDLEKINAIDALDKILDVFPMEESALIAIVIKDIVKILNIKPKNILSTKQPGEDHKRFFIDMTEYRGRALRKLIDESFEDQKTGLNNFVVVIADLIYAAVCFYKIQNELEKNGQTNIKK